MSSRSDTSLMQRLSTGPDSIAAQAIWQRYFTRLVELARRQLRGSVRRSHDEEDVALSVFDSFFRGVERNGFPKLTTGDDLWQVLMMLTERKVIDAIRRETAAKRGGGNVRGDSVFDNASTAPGFESLNGAEPTPEVAAAFTDECRRLFDMLGDPELRVVALLKMEGYTTEEIAASLDRVPRSIQRKLNTIRQIWQVDRSV